MTTELKTDILKRLGRVTLGEEPADIILNNGDVVNVYTGEVLKNQQIVIAGDRIAYVGTRCDFPAGPGTEVIDLEGQVAVPGFIDSHIHVDVWLKVDEFVRWSLPGGTTTVITDCSIPTNAMGTEGVKIFMRQCENQPQRFFFLASIISYLCSYRGNGRGAIDDSGITELLNLPGVLGLGEIYWSRVLNGEPDKDLIGLIGASIARGKTAEGHNAGAKNQKLAAVVAHGVDSCHEPITADEVRERLRLGLATMIRQGSVRCELEEVVGPLVDMNLDLRRAILVSDGVWPNRLISRGHMDNIVQQAIDLGLDPVRAIQMATLNAAEHFHLESYLGGIAPSKCADLVIIPDLKTVQARLVFCRGRLVAREGRLVVNPGKTDYPAEVYSCVNIPRVTADTFRIPASGSEIKMRAIQMVNNIVNREITLALPVVNGGVIAGGLEDVVKVAVLERYSGSGCRAIGFIKGTGLKQGAFASSFGFDEGNLVVIGENDVDMAAAVNRVKDLKGGVVYCCRGQVVEEIPMPIFGSVSDLTAPEVAARIESLEKAMKAAGWAFEVPLLTIFTISFTAIPSLRLSARGYWLSKESRIVDAVVG
jgi:adenine deaminase